MARLTAQMKKNLFTAVIFFVAISALSVTVWSASTPKVNYIWTEQSGSGSLNGPDDQHLKLTLKQVAPYVTRFTDRPVRHATAVANADFFQRWNGYFFNDPPNAVLTYRPVGSLQPASIVLTVSNPVYNAEKKTVTYDASRINRAITPDINASTALKIKDLKTPKSFSACSLFIDDASPAISTPGCPATYDDFISAAAFNQYATGSEDGYPTRLDYLVSPIRVNIIYASPDKTKVVVGFSMYCAFSSAPNLTLSLSVVGSSNPPVVCLSNEIPITFNVLTSPTGATYLTGGTLPNGDIVCDVEFCHFAVTALNSATGTVFSVSDINVDFNKVVANLANQTESAGMLAVQLNGYKFTCIVPRCIQSNYPCPPAN